MRIARSDVGNRPSSRFPNNPLQRNGSGTSMLRQLSKPRGRAAVGAHRYVSAVSAEIVGGTLPEKRFSRRFLRRNVPVRTRQSAERPHGRRRGVQPDQPGERRDAREDRAGEAVLAQGPDQAQQRHAAAPKMNRPRAAATLAQRRRRRIGGEPGRAKGTHRYVIALSVEIVGGTLPMKRFSKSSLRSSVPVQHERVGRETARAAAGRTGRPAG
jgi:hypothetical protein